jgi:hypothetical protein
MELEHFARQARRGISRQKPTPSRDTRYVVHIVVDRGKFGADGSPMGLKVRPQKRGQKVLAAGRKGQNFFSLTRQNLFVLIITIKRTFLHMSTFLRPPPLLGF